MKLDEIYQAIDDFIKSLPTFFHGVNIDYPLKNVTTAIGDWSNPDNMGMIVTGDNIGDKSGVYFFAKPNGDVFYIGKAQNLHKRVWGHIKTPSQNSTETVKKFPNHDFYSENAQDEMQSIADGSALLGVATISDEDLISLVEVFLHTFYVKKIGELPALNKQIG